jgi:glucose/arabinose dehydrogenase
MLAKTASPMRRIARPYFRSIRPRDSRAFASGLRNPNGLAWHANSGQLWTVVNERDLLGSDLVPEYLTSVKDGGFYGWLDLVAKAIVPDYALGAHTASLGLAFDSGLAPALRGRRLYRSAWLLELQSAQWIQSDLRAFRRWTSLRHA